MREPIGLLSKAAAVGAAHWASPAVEDGCCAFFSPPWAKAQAKAKNHNRRLREAAGSTALDGEEKGPAAGPTLRLRTASAAAALQESSGSSGRTPSLLLLAQVQGSKKNLAAGAWPPRTTTMSVEGLAWQSMLSTDTCFPVNSIPQSSRESRPVMASTPFTVGWQDSCF